MNMVQRVHVPKQTLHYVDENVGNRARFAQVATELKYHCELYENLEELLAYAPGNGIVIIKDSPKIGGGVVGAMEWLEKLGIWLSVIAVGDVVSPYMIVDAIKAGALDYIGLPIEAKRLQRSLARTVEEAGQVARFRRRKVEARQLLEKLSYREAEVLERLADGSSNKIIARELGISPRTVEVHRANMMHKLGAAHAAEAVRIKIEAGHLVD